MNFLKKFLESRSENFGLKNSDFDETVSNFDDVNKYGSFYHLGKRSSPLEDS